MKGFALLTLSLLLVGKAAATSPMAVSVSPSLASGNSQVFTATYSDDSGASVLNRRLFLIGSALTGSGTCFVQADPTGIYLVNDNDSGLLGPLAGSGTYSNSQCTLNGSGTSLVDVGTTSTLTVSLTFNSAYAGAKNIYMYTEDASGNSNWLFLGTFTVTSPATPMFWFDAATCTTMSGWAYSSQLPQAPLSVQILSDGNPVATVLANLYRADVVAAGVGGNGLVGFNIVTPAGLKDGATHTITATVPSLGWNATDSTGGPYHINCTAQTPAYTYTESVTTTPGPSDPGNWSAAGTVGSAYPGGTFLWSQTPTSWSSEYEVSTNITLAGNGGFYQHYIRAQAGALSGGGTSYLVELQNPTFTSSGECSATLATFEVINSSTTWINATTVPCSKQMTMRTVVYSNTVSTMINGEVYWTGTTHLASGLPGYGSWSVPSGNGISQVAVGPRNLAAPMPIDPSTVATSAFPDHVDIRWQDPVDTTGVGVPFHTLMRNNSGTFLEGSGNSGNITDNVVTPSTTYAYGVCEQSFHGVLSGCSGFGVTTPPAGNIDPRRYGVRSTGSYWGDKGEQIDTLSGNVNYTVPMFSANNRGGRTFNFALSYNSQMWRTDSGGTWMLGQDVGYGMGWKLQAGSLTPYYQGQSWSNLDHYVFTDSTGAEYKLYDPNHTGVWTSQDSIYVSYDFNANRLYFKDGSFWVMGCTSGGGEPDLGTMYPTTMEDTNGNYITVSYASGVGTSWPNSSARISQVVDNLAVTQPYLFNYDVSGRLLNIQIAIASAYLNTSIGFTYLTQNTVSPGSSPLAIGNTTVLAGVTNAPGYTTALAYNASDELTQVTFPTGGHFKYDYVTWNYQGSGGAPRQIREVATRHLAQNFNGSDDLQYPITRGTDANDGSLVVHSQFNIADPSGIGAKLWSFNASASTPVWMLGTAASLKELTSATSTVAPRQSFYTWAQNASGNAYITEKQTVWDGGSGYSKSSYEDMTQDQYGNIVTRNLRDFSNATTPIRKYHFYYVADAAYISRYMLNRLSVATLTDGSGNNAVTLVSNAYDLTGNLPAGCSAAAPPNLTSAPNHDANYPNSFTYRGNVSLQTTPQGVTCTLFDALGNAYFTKAPHSPAITTSTGSDTNFSLPAAITANGDNQSTVALSYSAFLTPSGFSGPNGATASILYDFYGRPSSSTSLDGAVTTYTYSLGTTPLTQLAVTAAPNGLYGFNNYGWTQTTVDGLGRAIKVQSGPGQTPGNAVTETDTFYGPCACSPTGKMKQVSQPFAPGSAVVWTTYGYDAIGRTISVVSPDGASTTQYTYQGASTTVTDPAGKTKTTTVDVQGNIVQVTEPDPANQPSGTLQTNYAYDVMEHLIQVSMPRGGYTQTRTFNYDPSSHLLTSETHPETGTTSYTYTNDGYTADLLTQKTDAKGQVTRYTYDPYYRVSTIQRFTPLGSMSQGPQNVYGTYDDICQRVHYIYDAAYPPNLALANTWGHVAAVSTGDPACYMDVPTGLQQQFTQYFSYTSAGRIATKRLQLFTEHGGDPTQSSTAWWDVSYTYNAYGQVVTTKYPDSPSGTGITYTTGYDSMQRPNTLSDSRGSTVTGVVYNAADQPLQTQFSFGGGPFVEYRSYNALNQLTSINGFVQQPYMPTGRNLNVSYTYSATQNNGQITGVVDNVFGQSVSYGYDALKRLTSATAVGGSYPWSQNYAYDGFGNMTAKTGSGSNFTVAVDASTNRLDNIGYDLNGNALNDPTGGMYTYDLANRLASANGLEEYMYGADNKRLSKYVGGSYPNQTVYVYGAQGELLSLAAPTGPVTANNLYFGGRMIKQNTDTGATTSPDGNFVETDRTGSVRGGGFAIGNLFTSVLYLPYGEVLPTPNNTPAPIQSSFATYYLDANTGLHYADQRYYSSGVGRFMSADRFRQAAQANDSGSWNKYSYTRNDPISRMDRRGTCDEPPLAEARKAHANLIECCPEGEDCDPDPDPGPDPGPDPVPDPVPNPGPGSKKVPCNPSILNALSLDYSQLLYKNGTQSSEDHIIERHDSGLSGVSQYYAKLFLQISNINRFTYLLGQQTLDSTRGLVTFTYTVPQITPGGNHIGTDAQGQETATNKLILKDDCKTVITSYPTN